MKTKTWIVVATLALAVPGVAVLAQADDEAGECEGRGGPGGRGHGHGGPGGPDGGRGFGPEFEGDLTLADMQTRALERFNEADVNGDGQLERSELPEERSRAAHMFERADADANDTLTEAEVLNHVEAKFTELDANSDGTITAEERPAHGPHGPGMMLHAADANGDREVTLDEFQAAAPQIFAELDTNGDGKISREDRPSEGGRGGRGR